VKETEKEKGQGQTEEQHSE